MLYPWQVTQWQSLMQAWQAKRLPHALLLSGSAGLGKLDFTYHLLHRLLCTTDNNADCHCHACHLITEHTHPNVLWVIPEKKGQAIKIDQIREINHFAYQSSLQDNYRVIIIHPANSMNINSANALLKTLEEPPLGCLFILISHDASLLPMTIRSRCQKVFFPTPEKNIALTWLTSQIKENTISPGLLLNIAKGAPLMALRLPTTFLSGRQTLFEALYLFSHHQACPVQTALALLEMDILEILDMIYSWLMDILRLKLNISYLTNQDYDSQLAELGKKLALSHLTAFMLRLNYIRKDIYQGVHLNKQLLLESVLIDYLNILTIENDRKR